MRPGATFPVRERITLGRAAVADVQLVDGSVSRFHALIERRDDGRHTIADLASAAGTRLDGNPVRVALLEEGAVVEICGFRLRYESVDDDAPPSAIPKVTGYVTVRPTQREQPAVTDDREPSTTAPAPDTQVVSEGPRLAEPQDHDWLSVLRDVVAFRQLRDTTDRDSPRAQFLAARFTEENDGRTATVRGGAYRHAQRRASRRHPCRTPVLVGMRRGPEVLTVVGHLVDASADGARVHTDDPLSVGGSCWLLVATGDGERSGIAFSARVVWTDAVRGHAGVAFVGRPVMGPDVLPPMRTG